MKAAVQPLVTQPALADKSWVAVYADLFKARLTLLALITMVVGVYLGSQGTVEYSRLLHALIGTALVACGASALNQLLERDFDACMRRTCDRPLPSGRLQPQTVFYIGLAASLFGVVYLELMTNFMTALLGAVTLISYVFIYTPLKRITWLNTAVGAVPGGLPPLMGWAAARGELSLEAASLFAIQALWQIPHFMAIAWIYRDEYARAGFRMLPVLDPKGRRTSRHALAHALLLLPISLVPFVLGISGAAYLSGALVLGLVFVWCAVRFSHRLSIPSARQLFYVSILYLPLVFGLMVLDKQSAPPQANGVMRNGVTEYWSDGVLGPRSGAFLHHSSTPSLQYSVGVSPHF